MYVFQMLSEIPIGKRMVGSLGSALSNLADSPSPETRYVNVNVIWDFT